MSREKVLKILWRVFLAGMSILTVLFFFDIKFVVLGINILVMDMLTAGIWAFARLCRWAGRENTAKRTIVVVVIILMGLFAAPVLLFGLGMYGGWTPERVLIEQPVDDDHSAFLVDTKGQLGKLLVTTELERTPTEDCRFTVHFSVWDPASMDEPLQTMTAGADFRPNCYTIDADFDGYMDFTCTYIQGNQVYYDHLWIWNEGDSRFESVPEYDEISVPDLDEETKTIYGFTPSSGGGTGLHTFHQWASGNLLCMRQIEIYHVGKSDTVRMSIQDRIANELVEIYHEDFSSESSGWLDAQMVWHNLDYHGEVE